MTNGAPNPKDEPEGPGKGFVNFAGVLGIMAYTLGITFLVIHGLVVLWPPNRSEEEADQLQEQIQATVASAVKESIRQTGSEPNRSEPLPEGEAGSTPAGNGPNPGSGTSPASTTSTASTTSPTPRASGTNGSSAETATPKKKVSADEQFCIDKGYEGQRKATFLWVWHPCLSPEERLFLIVLLAGALGGLGHAFRSIYWYVGNRKLVWSWLPMYIFLPIEGAALAVIFYLVIRGGFFSPQSQVSDTSPFGFAALAVLIGMFTVQASKKLKDIAETILTQAETGKDHASPAPVVIKLDPTQGTVAGGDTVKITGKDFVKTPTVKFGGQPAPQVTVSDDGTSMTVVTPPAQQPGSVSVEVTNPDNQSVTFTGFTYQ